MCTQTVGLIAGVLESRGIATVSAALLRFVAERVQPPRALFVPRDHGLTMGAAHDRATHRETVLAMLDLLAEPGPGPLLR